MKYRIITQIRHKRSSDPFLFCQDFFGDPFYVEADCDREAINKANAYFYAMDIEYKTTIDANHIID